ncbi:uncharacterized protein LOC135485455 isoform X2 [Lineus longissimus]|uniref:uncharacterized protein LOC135485455 isoform X2 n=1 Tax=Lineus longissimus TaxID=88925 RepID=UPI002B4CEF9A
MIKTPLPVSGSPPLLRSSSSHKMAPRNMTGLYLGRDLMQAVMRPSSATFKLEEVNSSPELITVKSHTTEKEPTVSTVLYPADLEAEQDDLEQADLPMKKAQSALLPRGRGCAYRCKTPTEERRYAKVESLRSKEESVRRGFTGNPLKRKPRYSSPPPTAQSTPRNYESYGLDVIKQNPRNYTMILNNGIRHYEYLQNGHKYDNCLPHEEVFNYNISEHAAEEFQRIARSKRDLIGVEEAYQNICKGNSETLYSLLPKPSVLRQRNRQQSSKSTSKLCTGLTIKSYRNPNQAEIIACFPSDGRPKTVPGMRPMVPSPYFYKITNMSKNTSHSAKARTHSGYSHDKPTEKIQGQIVAAPGAGVISKNLSSSRPLPPTEGVIAAPSSPEPDQQPNPFQSGSKPDDSHISVPGADVEISSDQGSRKSVVITAAKPKMAANKALEVAIEVKNEDGETESVEIDEVDDEIQRDREREIEAVTPYGQYTRCRRQSITDRLKKRRSSEIATEIIRLSAINRKREFNELLDEHARLVEEIERSEEHEEKENLSQHNQKTPSNKTT